MSYLVWSFGEADDRNIIYRDLWRERFGEFRKDILYHTVYDINLAIAHSARTVSRCTKIDAGTLN